MEEALLQLIAWVREASPEVWGYALKQVRVTVALDFIWSAICAVVAVGLGLLTAYGKRAADDDSFSPWEIIMVFSGIGVLAAGIISLVLLSDGVALVLNPEWYAIKLLLGTIK